MLFPLRLKISDTVEFKQLLVIFNFEKRFKTKVTNRVRKKKRNNIVNTFTVHLTALFIINSSETENYYRKYRDNFDSETNVQMWFEYWGNDKWISRPENRTENL